MGKHWKTILAAIFSVVLIVTAAGTSCTGNNLQHYAQETVAPQFAPLIDEVDGKITDGSQINAELIYATYITLFDHDKRYADVEKASFRQRLVPCFYTVELVRVQDVDSSGKPTGSYHTEEHYHALTDSSEIFNKVEQQFSLKIEKARRDYIISLSETLTNYGSYSLNGNVSGYAAAICQACGKYGIPQYAALVQAVMQQESGGSGNDPMQCSECGYNTRFPHTPNSITDPNYSIQCGVQNLAACLRASKCKSQSDMPGISLALQGYNFGNGYIAWALQRGGYSQANAIEFSEAEQKKLGTSGYGDVNYVSHVLRYYNAGSGGSGGFAYPIQTGKYTISSGYGYRSDPTAAGNEFHKGIDLAADAGTPIYAAAPGTVIYAQFGIQPYGGYGNLVIIKHSSSLVSMYAHCSKLLVSPGQAVQRGQMIALVGSTGDSTGSHCHFEIRLDGKSVDPMSYLK